MTRNRLQDEIKQTRPFRSTSQEAALSLIRTADQVRRGFAGVVEPHGITQQQYNVLRILRGAGAGGLPTLDVASRMVEHAPGITRLLDRLEREGLVRRDRDKGDRRAVICRATPKALSLLASLDAPVNAFDDACLSMLAERELRTLIRILSKVRAARAAPARRR